MARSGIYKIVNLINDKIYIGSACSFENRKSQHFSGLRLSKHGNSKLQNSFNKYGEQNFTMSLIEECEKQDLIIREQYYIDTLNPEYNICKIAGSSLGRVATEETLKKLRGNTNKIGKKVSEEGRKNIRAAKKKEFLDNPNLVKILSERAKGNTNKRGTKLTYETKLKISQNSVNKKLTENDVNEIRKVFIPFNRSCSARNLAKTYNVSHQLISRIVNYKERVL